MQNGFIYPISTHKQHWNHSSLGREDGDKNLPQELKHTLLQNLVIFGVPHFCLNKMCPEGLGIHRADPQLADFWAPLMLSTIHAVGPGPVVAIMAHQEQSWTLITWALPSFCHHVNHSLWQQSKFWPKSLEPRVMWNSIGQHSFTHLLQLEWNPGSRLTHLACLPRGNKHLISRKESRRA